MDYSEPLPSEQGKGTFCFWERSVSRLEAAPAIILKRLDSRLLGNDRNDKVHPTQTLPLEGERNFMSADV